MTKDIPKVKALADIEVLSKSEAERLWLHYFKLRWPVGLSIKLGRPILAHEFQTRQYGGLDRASKAALKQVLAPESKRKTKLRSGSQLIREWNGVTHKVEVMESGYQWQGQQYRSLSAIAEAITGAHWSGPRFFGIKRNPKSGNRFSEKIARQTHRGAKHGNA